MGRIERWRGVVRFFGGGWWYEAGVVVGRLEGVVWEGVKLRVKRPCSEKFRPCSDVFRA